MYLGGHKELFLKSEMALSFNVTFEFYLKGDNINTSADLNARSSTVEAAGFHVITKAV